MIWIVFGACSGFLSVVCGAFGAHALSTRLDPKMLAVFQTGAQYQMYHALALVLLGACSLASVELVGTALTVSGWAFVFGSVVFSGSLYALALSGVRWLGAITPIGGLAFMVGWLAMAVAGFKAWAK